MMPASVSLKFLVTGINTFPFCRSLELIGGTECSCMPNTVSFQIKDRFVVERCGGHEKHYFFLKLSALSFIKVLLF